MNTREEMIGRIWEEFSKSKDIKRRTEIMLALFARIPDMDIMAVGVELNLVETEVSK